MWTIAAVNKKINGPLGSYNGLTDVHLAHYFSRPNQQSHLKAAKLISNDGTIIPEQTVKISSLQYEKKSKMYDILANTLIQNAAHKEGSWNKKLSNCLEDVLKMENVEKVKGKSRERHGNISCDRFLKNSMITTSFEHYNIRKWLSNKNNERNIPTTPRSAPTTSRSAFKNHVPNLHSSLSKIKRCFSAKETSPYVFPLFLCSSHAHNSRNCLRQTMNSKKKKKCKKNAINVEPKNPSSTDTASTKISKLYIPDHNFNIGQCKVTLYYHGHTPLANSQMGIKEEVLIRQQHCGGTPVIIYKGQVSPNETVKFICLDHEGFTFSITLFLDGIRYLKLSSCCIYRYSPGRRLGGSSGSFSFQDILGGKPCDKCLYRQIENSGTDLIQKFRHSEDITSLDKDEIHVLHSNLRERNFTPVTVNNDFMENPNNQDHTEEDIASSVASEIIHSPSEDIEENSEGIDDNVTIDNDVSEDLIQLEDANVSIEENLDVAVESDNESESTEDSITESVKNFVKTDEVKPYQSESSDEDDHGVKEHVIVASVHGSPTRNT